MKVYYQLKEPSTLSSTPISLVKMKYSYIVNYTHIYTLRLYRLQFFFSNTQVF